MPSYSYNNGDGLAVLDKTKPNGAVEPVSILDDALKQVKAYLVDPVAGVAKIQADLTQGQTDITALATRVTTAETNITAGATAITTLQTDQAATQTQVDSLVITAGGAPVTLVAIMNAAQNCLSTDILNGVNFNSIALDSGNGFNIITHIYTVPTAGLYLLTGAIKVSTTASAAPTAIVHHLIIKVNGIIAGTMEVPTSVTTDRTIEINRRFQCAATNTLELLYQVTVGSGSMTSQIQTGADGTILQISRLTA